MTAAVARRLADGIAKRDSGSHARETAADTADAGGKIITATRIREGHAQQPQFLKCAGTSLHLRNAAQGGLVPASQPAQHFALNSLQCQFLDPAVETAFRKWQAEVMFYKVRPST